MEYTQLDLIEPGTEHLEERSTPATWFDLAKNSSSCQILEELVDYLKLRRTGIHAIWVRNILRSGFLSSMTREEIITECSALLDNYISTLQTDSQEALDAHAHDICSRIIPMGVDTKDIVGIILLLRDILGRVLFSKYGRNLQILKNMLDVYEPAANKIAITVSTRFINDYLRIIDEQRQSIMALSTPLLPVKDRLLILSLIGVMDAERTLSMMNKLLKEIRAHRAKVVVIDMSAASSMDVVAASYWIQACHAARLIGSELIFSGIGEAIAETLIALKTNMSDLTVTGDLKSAVNKAESMLTCYFGTTLNV